MPKPTRTLDIRRLLAKAVFAVTFLISFTILVIFPVALLAAVAESWLIAIMVYVVAAGTIFSIGYLFEWASRTLENGR